MEQMMADTAIPFAIKRDEKQEIRPALTRIWHPASSMRRDLYRFFDDFDRSLWLLPFRESFFDVEPSWSETPAVDIAEHERAFEIAVELPGLDEKNVQIEVANGAVTITGSKTEEKTERNKTYHLHERRFGSFERRFPVPDGVDVVKIEATFKKGVLTVTMPKTLEAQKAKRKIEIKAA